MKNLLPVLHSAVIIMTPLLFASAGGLYTGLAGMLNIALEGLLLIGAFAAVAAVYFTGNFAVGLVAAVTASMALAYIVAFTTLRLRSNVFIVGLAANLLAGGLSIVLSQSFFNTRGVVVLRDIEPLPQINIPVIERIPIIGDLLSGHSLYVYASLLLLLVAWVIIFKTPFGYRLRACGMKPEALRSLGINVEPYQYIAFLISGFYCGIGGSFLSLNLGAFVPNIQAGRGWIALVLIYLGRRHPLGLLAAAFVFGLAEAFSNYAQGLFNIPADFILAMPYVITLLAMIAVSIYAKNKSLATDNL